MPDYLAVLNGFNALYLLKDGVFQPLTLAQCQQWLPGVHLCETGPRGEHVRVLAEVPRTRNKGMICVRIINAPGGTKSTTLFGCQSAVSADDAMARLGRHISGAGVGGDENDTKDDGDNVGVVGGPAAPCAGRPSPPLQ